MKSSLQLSHVTRCKGLDEQTCELGAFPEIVRLDNSLQLDKRFSQIPCSNSFLKVFIRSTWNLSKVWNHFHLLEFSVIVLTDRSPCMSFSHWKVHNAEHCCKLVVEFVLFIRATLSCFECLFHSGFRLGTCETGTHP